MESRTKASIRRIGIDELMPRMKNLVFIDARSTTALARNPLQVPGAVHVSVKTFDEKVGLLPRDRAMVTYCT